MKIINKNNCFLLPLILLAAAAGYISIDLYLPSLPAIAKSYAVNPAAVQSTVTTFLIGFCLSQVIYGPLSDYYGRCRILSIGAVIYLVGSCLCFTATTIHLLLLARLIQGLGIGAGATLSRAMLRDAFSGKKLAQMSSHLNTTVTVIVTLAPIIGGFIQQKFNYHGNFIFMLLFGIILLFLVNLSPEPNQNKITAKINIREIINNYYNILTKKAFIGNIICSGAALAILVAYSILCPFLLQTQLGFSAAAYGLLIFIAASCEVIGSFISGFLVNKIEHQSVLLLGLFIILIASAMMLLFGSFITFNVFSLLLPTMLAATGLGMIFPNASTGAFSAFTTRIGTVGALYGSLQLLIAASSTTLITALKIHSQLGLGCIMLLLSIIGLYASRVAKKCTD